MLFGASEVPESSSNATEDVRLVVMTAPAVAPTSVFGIRKLKERRSHLENRAGHLALGAEEY